MICSEMWATTDFHSLIINASVSTQVFLTCARAGNLAALWQFETRTRTDQDMCVGGFQTVLELTVLGGVGLPPCPWAVPN